MKVKFTWTPSVSVGVVSQQLKTDINGEVAVLDLGASVDNQTVTLNEGDVLGVSLRAFNGVKFSSALTGTFNAPVSPAPEAPTNLTFEVVEE